MVPAGYIFGLLGHVVESNGAAGASTGVGMRAVPDQCVMVVNLSLFNGAAHHIELLVVEGVRHGIIGIQRADEVHIIPPLMGAGDHAHAAVVFIGIIEGDPGGDLSHGCDDGPKGRVLVPHVDAADLGWFVLDLIVPDAQFGGMGQLRNARRNFGVGHQISEGLAGLPNIDDLPDRRIVIT